MKTALVERTVPLQNSIVWQRERNVDIYKVKPKNINSEHLSDILDALGAFLTLTNRTTEH